LSSGRLSKVGLGLVRLVHVSVGCIRCPASYLEGNGWSSSVWARGVNWRGCRRGFGVVGHQVTRTAG
jgi:hypothetical protein